MSSMNHGSSVERAQQVSRAAPARGGLPRPTSRPAAGPASPRQRPAAGSRAGAGGGGEVTWGQAGSSLWKSGAQAASGEKRRQVMSRASTARVPTGNREVVRRALFPPRATRGRAAALRRWSFRPAPSRLRNASSSFSSSSSASPRPS